MNPRPEEFKRFYDLLMKGAPEGYMPWLFKCRPGQKDPVRGISWKNPRHRLTLDRALEWMVEGGNVGIAGMKNDSLVNVDLDGHNVDKTTLKPTLTSRSRSRTGIHGFYYTKDKTTIPNIPTDNDGEVRSQGQYVIAPGSYVTTDPEKVPEGQREHAGYYTIEDARPPAWITYDDLPAVFREQHTKDSEKTPREPKKIDPKRTEGKHSAVFDVTARDVAAREGGDTDPHERWGSLFHDSETDANMSLSDEGILQCWRHNVAHNGFGSLVVLSGYMTCREAGVPHEGQAGASRIPDDLDAATFHAWRYAKDAGYIADDDPMPTYAMRHIAEKYLGFKAEKDEKLPLQVYRGVLENMSREYPGLNTGRKLHASAAKPSEGCVKCGEKLKDGACPSCGWAPVELRQVLDDYVVEVTAEGYILRNYETDLAVISFRATGSGTARDIANTLSLDVDKVKRQLAEIDDYAEKMRVTFKPEQGEQPQTSFKMVPNLITSKFIAEEVWDGRGAPQFVVRHFDQEGFTYASDISLGEFDEKDRPIVYVPCFTDHLTKGMVTVPRKPRTCTLREALEAAFAFVSNLDYYDPCGKELQVKTLALISVGSWFHDKMTPKTSIPVAGVGRFAPIIPIRGPSGSGKNRLANLLRFILYHPYFDLSKTNIPSLFRPLDTWRGSLIMDEADVKHSGADAELTRFLNSRATGTPIARQNPDNVSESQAFHSFGLTMVTQRQQFDDNATEDRSVPYYSEKTTTRLPTVELDEVVEAGLELQDMMLYLRMTLWEKVEIDKAQWHPNLTDARLNASLLPVFALAVHEPWIMEVIDQTVKVIEAQKRKRKATSIDGQLVNHVWDKLENSLFDTYEQRYYVLKEHNVTTDDQGNEKETKTPLVASHVKEAIGLGYKTVRKVWDSVNVAPDDAPALVRVGRRVYRVLWFDPARLEKMLGEFVVDYEPLSLYDKLGIPKPVTDVTRVTDPMSVGIDAECGGSKNEPHTTEEPLHIQEPLHPLHPLQPEGHPVINLPRETQQAIVDAAQEFLVKLPRQRADHDHLEAHLMRLHPVTVNDIRGILWEHPEFTRPDSHGLMYTPKEASV